MVQVPGLVKLRSAFTREGVGGACDVMDDLVPANRAKIQLSVFILGMREHTAREHLALAVARPIDDCFLELVMAVFA